MAGAFSSDITVTDGGCSVWLGHLVGSVADAGAEIDVFELRRKEIRDRIGWLRIPVMVAVCILHCIRFSGGQ